MGRHSPAGEDFSFAIEHNDDVEQAVKEIKDYAEYFDINEHIEMWVEARKNGFPGVPSIRELCEDAQAIKDMLEELSDSISDKSPNKKKSLNELITQANAISEQAKKLSDNLQQHKTEMEH